jgi:hypothetical protein
MSDKQVTSSYVELSSQAYGLFVDAFADYNQRTLAYYRSMWDIVSRPYASTAVETTVRENFDRANQAVALTVNELSTNGAKTAEFAEKMTRHAAKLQDAAAEAFRGVVTTGISNMNYVKETTAQQFDEIAKRLDDVQSRATAPVSTN